MRDFPTSLSGRDLVYYLAASVLVILVLIGINRLSKVESAVSGNHLSALSILLAIILTLWYFAVFTLIDLWIGLLLGSAVGLLMARRVRMIQMPQMVGLLNGLGGAASMLAGVLTLINGAVPTRFELITAGLAIAVGGLTLSGSLVAAAKLQGLIAGKPRVFPGHQIWTGVTALLLLLSVALFAAAPFRAVVRANLLTIMLIMVCVLLALLFGYLFAIRVGGADMPITISLLNSLSGVAGSIAGMAIGDPLLVAIGGVVGASGLLLTQIMCRAMNRRLSDILFGREVRVSPAKHAPAATPPEQAAPEADRSVDEEDEPIARAAQLIVAARHVMIVPGYGMALSQAQPLVRELDDWLEQHDIEVTFGIHPVAGRMPGHMNVLLAEVDIAYDKMLELDEANEHMAETDAVIVIGANDVINPAAGTAAGTPIYGMPILEIDQARHIIICNFDDKPGYAGVDNPLYRRTGDQVTLLFADAAETLTALLQHLGKL